MTQQQQQNRPVCQMASAECLSTTSSMQTFEEARMSLGSLRQPNQHQNLPRRFNYNGLRPQAATPSLSTGAFERLQQRKQRLQQLRTKQNLSFLRSLARFFASTSLHGVNRVFDGDSQRSPCQLVWLTIVCLATLGLCLHIGQEVSHYLSYPLSSSQRLALNSFNYPDVTLCDPESPIRTRSVGLSELGSANDKIQNVTGIWSDPAYRPMCRYEHYFNFSQIGVRPLDSVIHCRYNGGLCSWRNFTVFFDRAYGNCMTFRPAHRRLRRADLASGLTLLLYHPSADASLERAGVVGKMGYKMRVREMAFQGESVLLTIHPEDTIPHPHENAHMAPLGRVTLIALKQDSTLIRPTPTHPCQPERSIRMYDSLLRRHVTYANTLYDCANWRDKMDILRKCGCIPEGLVDAEDFPDPQAIPFCHNVVRGPIDNPAEFLSQVQPDNDSTAGLEDYLRRRHPRIYRQLQQFLCFRTTSFEYNATCYETCRSDSYSAKISTADWPHRADQAGDDHLKQILEISEIIQAYIDAEPGADNLLRQSLNRQNISLTDCHRRLDHFKLDEPEIRETAATQSAIESCLRVHEFVRRRFLLVRVYPQTLTVKQLSIEPSFQLPQLLSSVGGCLGLWIGVSLVTVFEFGEVLLLVGSYVITRCITPAEAADADFLRESTSASGSASAAAATVGTVDVTDENGGGAELFGLL